MSDETCKPSTYKCLSFYSKSSLDDKILLHLGSISKNIYNITLFCKKYYDSYKTILYKNLYDNYDTLYNVNIETYLHEQILINYGKYTQIYQDIKNNNTYIYKKITKEINLMKLIITTDNVVQIYNSYLWSLKDDINIKTNKENYDILYTDIISNIIFSIYQKNYKTITNEMLEHRKYTFYNEDIINDINTKRKMIDNNKSTNYKELCSKKYNTTIKSDQNFVGRLVYKQLNDNHQKLDSTMIGTIINKIYKAYASYYNARKKNINSKVQLPNYLDKNDKFTLNYVVSDADINIDENKIRIFTSQYLSKNFNIIDENYVNMGINKYIHKTYLKSKSKKKYSKTKPMKCKQDKPCKKNSYFYKEYYVYKNDENIIDSKYVYISYPKILHNKKIKTIEIIFENGRIKYCVNYTNDIIINTTNINVTDVPNIDSKDTISIDFGVKNLATIYDPVGQSLIIPGNVLVSTNYHYSKSIAKAQSENNKNKILKLQNKRNYIVNNYFNLIVKWLEINYAHKKMFIIGYNEQWKHKSNLGRKNNMCFNKIPYATLIKKLKDKFHNKGIVIKTNEESYTSLCDALSLEKICRHEKYMGMRIKRGLFSSEKNKLINADINGAINIMRKIYKNFVNENKNKYVFNPIRINIFREVLNQRIKGHSNP